MSGERSGKCGVTERVYDCYITLMDGDYAISFIFVHVFLKENY